jgi:hypothetical protein
VDYLKASVSRRDLWWLLLPAPYLVDALANREVTEVVVLDSCAASVLLMASFLPSEMIWSDFVIGAVEASRMVIGSIAVPGAWSPFAAPSLMICFSMACAGVHSSVLAAFAFVAAVADMIAGSSGFEEAAVMHALACAYVVACAAIMEHRVCGQLVGPAANSSGYRQLRLPGFGHGGTASRTLGGEVYHAVHDDTAMSRNILSDCEEDVPAFAHPERRGRRPDAHGGSALSTLALERDQRDEEQGYVVSPSPGSVAASPRALDSASPAVAELLESEQSVAEAEALFLRSPECGDLNGALTSMQERVGSVAASPRALDSTSPAVAELLESEQLVAKAEAEASLLRSPERGDLNGALTSMQEMVQSLNSSGHIPRDLTYDDELHLASRTVDSADASPSPIAAMGSPPQPTSPETGLQAVKLGGFKTEAFNAFFVEYPNAKSRVNGQSTWWSGKDWFIFYSPQTRTWGIARGSRLDRVRAGQSQPHAHSPAGYDLLRGAELEPPAGWKEWDAEAGEAGQWMTRPGSGVRSRGRVRPRPRPVDEALSPEAPEGGRFRAVRPEVNRSPQPVHLATGSSPERPSPPLPPPAEPPAADMHFGSYSPLRTPDRELASAKRPGGSSWWGRTMAFPHRTG